MAVCHATILEHIGSCRMRTIAPDECHPGIDTAACIPTPNTRTSTPTCNELLQWPYVLHSQNLCTLLAHLPHVTFGDTKNAKQYCLRRSAHSSSMRSLHRTGQTWNRYTIQRRDASSNPVKGTAKHQHAVYGIWTLWPQPLEDLHVGVCGNQRTAARSTALIR